MIVATFPAAVVTADAGGGDRRTIGGVAVPWEVEGRVSSGETVVFHRGSLDPSSRPVLLRDHDRTRPIGRVIDAADRGDALTARARIAATRDGDDALLLAAPPDQVLGALSVGADPTEWHYDERGVMHVTAGDWQELSLLTIGAYPDARVSTVTATATVEDPNMPTMTDEPVAPDVPEPDVPEPDVPEPDTPDDLYITAGAATPPAPRSPAVVPLRAGGGAAARPPVTLSAVARTISAGMRSARITTGSKAGGIQAALANLTTSDVAGIVRPAYRSELVGLIDYGMPLVRALEQRPLPASGMSIEYPVWTTTPSYTAVQSRGLSGTVGGAPGEKTAIATGESVIGVASDDIETWAQGADVSFQAVNRSDPSFIEAWLRAAGVDAGTKYDAAVATKLLAVATAGTPGTTFLENVKALFAEMDPTTKKIPPGPLFLALAYDVWLETIDVTGLEGPAYWDLSVNFGSMLPEQSTGSLFTFLDPVLPAGTMLLGSRSAAANYGGPDTSADIRVVDVSLLGIDIGVYFYAACAVEYPEAFAKITVPVIPLGTSTSKSSK